MSNLLDARGEPMVSRDLTDQQIMVAFQQFAQRMDMMSQQVVHLGLFTEFLYEKVASATDAEGNPLVAIDMDEFEAFATERYKDIQEKVQERIEAQQATPVNEAIDLSE